MREVSLARRWGIAILVLAATSSGVGGGPILAQMPAPLVYRRVYVPEAAIDSQVRGLLPLKREEFERQLKIADAGEAAASLGPTKVRIDEISCRATLTSDRRLKGTAQFTVVAAGESAILSLEPCNLVLGAARWLGDVERRASVGRDPAGTLACLVDRSGKLDLDWSLRPVQNAPELATFDVRLPPALLCRLQIAAPEGVELTAETGIVHRGDPLPGDSSFRLWTVLLPGRCQTRLLVHWARSRPADLPLVVVREETRYVLFRSTLDLESTLTLDVRQTPLSKLSLEVDSALQVTAVRLDEQPLTFSVVDDSAAVTTQLAVDLPADQVGPGHILQIRGTANWPDNKRFKLSRVSVSGAVYEQGQATILAPPWLRLAVRPLAGCLQTDVAPAAPGRNLDQFDFQLHAADAAIEISAGRSFAPLAETSGTQIQVESTQIAGTLIAELSALGGERFEVEAVLPRQWILDAVETQPPEVLAHRRLTPRGTDQQLLRLSLARPLVEGRPLRLVIRGHCRRPANNQPLTGDFFRLVTFPDVRDDRRLVTVHVADPGVQLDLADDDSFVRLDLQKLSPAEQRLFESPPGPLLFEAKADRARGVLTSITARYRANVVVQAAVTPGELRQTTEIRCWPESSAVASLLVRVAPRPSGTITWRLRGEDARELVAAPVPEADVAAAASDEAIYRLALPRPRSTPFDVLGEWPVTKAGAQEIGLAWLPEASSQADFVEIHSLGGGELAITANQVQPLPAPLTPPDRTTTLRARYRYEAGRRAHIHVRPASARDSQPAAWVQRLQLTSRFAADGRGEHDAMITIANTGLTEFPVRLPAAAGDVRWSSDGGDAAASSGTAGEWLAIPLPAGHRQAVVRLRYSSPGSAPQWRPWGRLAAPIPEVGLPILSRDWSVHLPPGLAATAKGRASGDFGKSTSPAPLAVLPAVLPRPGQVGTLAAALLSGPALATKMAALDRPPAAAAVDPQFAGGTKLSLDLPSAPAGELTVYRPAAAAVWSICLGFITLALTLRARPHLSWTLPAAGVLSAAAILCAPPLAWLHLGACLGLTSGALAMLFRPPTPHRSIRGGSSDFRSTAVLAGGPTVGVLLLGFCWTAASWCTLPAVAADASPSRQLVVMPVDEAGQSVGDYVFLSPSFYESLSRLAEGVSTALPKYLLEDSRYALPAAPRMSGAVAAVDEIRASLDFSTFYATANVELPLELSDVLLLEGRARLDGQAVTLHWRSDGKALVLAVPLPGRHRLELALGAAARVGNDGLLLDFAIPPAARGVAMLPKEAVPSVAVLSAADPQPAAGRDSSREIPLSAARRLTVRWPLAGAPNAASASVEAEQLLWWNIKPGSVVVEGRFKLRPVGGSVHELQIAVDPRLRLVPAASGNSVSTIPGEQGAPSTVRVLLNEPASGEVNIRLSWLWPEVSGGGTLVLPRIALQTDHLMRTWTAVSADPALQVESASPAAAPSSADFVQAWAVPAQPPSIVWLESPDARPHSLVVQPVPRLPQAEQAIDWSVSLGSATANFTAHLTAVPPTCLEYRLAMPRDLKVTRVALHQEGRSAPVRVRWSQQAEGSLIVTLLEPPPPSQELNVTAEMSLATSRAQWPLPRIRLDSAVRKSLRTRIYRQHDAQIRVQSAAGWKREDDPELGQYREQWGRLSAVLATDAAAGETQPVLSRMPNEPQVSGLMLIRAREDDGDWQGEVELRLDVAQGVLDQVRLAVPEQWSSSLRAEGAVLERSSAALGEPRQQVILRPRQAVSGPLRMTLRGPLTSSDAGVRAPDVGILGMPRVQRLVLLDLRAGAERIDWDSAGLLAAERESPDLPPEWQVAGSELLRVVTPRFDAAARVQRPARAAPRVLLTDIHAELHSPRRLVATTTFQVQPAGARGAILAMPPGCRLVQILADGVPAQYTPAGLRLWKIATPSRDLPYSLTLVYDAAIPLVPEMAHEFSLPAPRLVGAEVERTIWTVISNPGVTRAEGAEAALETSGSYETELIRLEVAISALEDVVAAQGTDVPPAVVADSFQRWHAAYRAAHRHLEALGRPLGDNAAALAQRLVAAENDVAKVEKRMTPSTAGDATETTSLTMSPAYEPFGQTNYFTAVGAAETPTIRLLASPVSAGPSAATLAALVALGSFALGLLLGWSPAQEWLIAHGHLVLAAAGLAWWLLAPLGWLGWLLVLAAVWLSFLWPWRQRSYDHGSSIRRLSLSKVS